MAVPGPQPTRPPRKHRAPKKPTIIGPAQNCSCVDAINVVCQGEKTFLIEDAVHAVCPMKQSIRSIRQALHCTDLKVREAVNASRGPVVPRSRDEALDDTGACAGELPRPVPPSSNRPRFNSFVGQLQKQKASVHLLPAVVAAHAVLPLLWAPGEDDIFYDHQNMWTKRGWESYNRHPDPFTNSTMAFLPEVAPKASSKAWGRCAVIGNSGILNSDNKGAEISAHDTIVRINQAPFLPKYYDAIGNRTDVRLLNHKLTEMYSGHYRDLIYRDPNATYIATRADTEHFEKLGKRMQQWHPHNQLLFSTSDVVRHGHAMLASFRAGFEEATGLVFRGGNSPSSGLVAIQIARQMCTSVDIYGFALGNCLGGCPRYHYWRGADGPERGSSSSYKGHQYDVEGWLLKALHIMGTVCVSPRPRKMPPCGSRLGGLLAEDGSLTDPGMLNRLEELFFTPEFLKILYDSPQSASASSARRGQGSSSRRPGSSVQHGSRRPGSGRMTGTRRRGGRNML